MALCEGSLTPKAAKKSAWLDPPPALSMYCSTQALPSEADVVIIGAGFSGVSVAYHLLNAYPSLNVVLLEAGSICNGATGRNGGHLRPDLYTYTTSVTKQYGAEEAVRQNKFERANFDALKQLLAEDGKATECELVDNGECWRVFLTQAEFINALKELHAMRSSGGDIHDIRVYQRDEVMRITGIRGCYGAIVSPASSILPTKLVSHLLEQSLLKGLNLQTYTRVFKIQPNSPSFSPSSSADGEQNVEDYCSVDLSSLRITPTKTSYLYDITTSKGTILANKIVHATNAYLDTLLQLSADMPTKLSRADKLVTPVRGHVIEVQPLGPRQSLSRDPSHNITNMSFNDGGEYLIQRPNGNLVLGGGRRFGSKQGIESFDASESSDGIDPAVDLYLRAFLPQTLGFDCGQYLGTGASEISNLLSSKNFKVVNQWTGIMGFSSDLNPFVGRVKSFPIQGQEYCIAGFTGHGMPRIFLSAKALVRMILMNDADYVYDSQNLSDLTKELNLETVDGTVELPKAFEITDERIRRIANSIKTTS
ncbi:FAD dependent oxidoreductase [Limtongia smithiae]|uniref:FAD dependent oxidoreductase n=1 Tax=Limtongia smithiae TaxID=1125753 RepID=UPI0034CF634C